jgi:hypothetical protein
MVLSLAAKFNLSFGLDLRIFTALDFVLSLL